MSVFVHALHLYPFYYICCTPGVSLVSTISTKHTIVEAQKVRLFEQFTNYTLLLIVV